MVPSYCGSLQWRCKDDPILLVSRSVTFFDVQEDSLCRDTTKSFFLSQRTYVSMMSSRASSIPTRLGDIPHVAVGSLHRAPSTVLECTVDCARHHVPTTRSGTSQNTPPPLLIEIRSRNFKSKASISESFISGLVNAEIALKFFVRGWSMLECRNMRKLAFNLESSVLAIFKDSCAVMLPNTGRDTKHKANRTT